MHGAELLNLLRTLNHLYIYHEYFLYRNKLKLVDFFFIILCKRINFRSVADEPVYNEFENKPRRLLRPPWNRGGVGVGVRKTMI